MEPYYYQKMNKPQQAAYHAMQQGVLALADEIQLPRIPAEELYDVFFRLRLDHPEIFWVVSYRYRYYQDSPNIIFVPEYLFEKNKIREHQKAMPGGKAGKICRKVHRVGKREVHSRLYLRKYHLR